MPTAEDKLAFVCPKDLHAGKNDKIKAFVMNKVEDYLGPQEDNTLLEYIITMLDNNKSLREVAGELEAFFEAESLAFVTSLYDIISSDETEKIDTKNKVKESTSGTEQTKKGLTSSRDKKKDVIKKDLLTKKDKESSSSNRTTKRSSSNIEDRLSTGNKRNRKSNESSSYRDDRDRDSTRDRRSRSSNDRDRGDRDRGDRDRGVRDRGDHDRGDREPRNHRDSKKPEANLPQDPQEMMAVFQQNMMQMMEMGQKMGVINGGRGGFVPGRGRGFAPTRGRGRGRGFIPGRGGRGRGQIFEHQTYIRPSDMDSGLNALR